jgi:hypothetical protein
LKAVQIIKEKRFSISGIRHYRYATNNNASKRVGAWLMTM